MSTKTSVGIDIGTYNIKVVVGTTNPKQSSLPKILGTGFAQSKGMRYGYIINSADLQKSLKKAIQMAEKSSGTEITHAYLSIGGVSLDAITAKGTVIIARGDNEITELDVERCLEAAEDSIPKSEIINKKILHNVPHSFTLDGHEVLGRPVGMKGVKLEASVLFVACLEQHLHDIVQAVEELGVEVDDVIASPVAASIVTLSKAQKVAGCVLANIGSETVSLIVYENNLPISLAVFPIGSNDITNDIALGLKVPLEEAEQIKLGGLVGATYSRKEYEEIVAKRLTNIFELIENHLEKINKSGKLPAGIIITGGGSSIASIEELARAILRLPTKTSRIQEIAPVHTNIKDASWSVAYGLCVLGLTSEKEHAGISNFSTSLRRVTDKFFGWIRQFLP